MTITQLSPSNSKKEDKRDYWSAHIKQWEESKLSQQAYCMQASIKLNSFTYWRSLLRSRLRKDNQNKFLRVKVAANHAISSEVPRSIQIKLLSGHVVHIPTSLDAKEIATLIHFLGVPHA